MTDIIYKIPPVSEVDFSDADAICGYQLLLCKIFEREGGFQIPPVVNPSIREVQTQGLIWLKEVKVLINDILDGKRLPLSSIPELLDSYDFFYRVCNGKDPSGYIRDVRLKAVDRWVKEDSSISRTEMVIELLKEVYRDIRSIENKYSLYALKLSGEWAEELAKYGWFKDIPKEEVYRRLTFLIDSDLFAYFGTAGQNEYKSRWIKAYTLSDEDLDLLDTPALGAYIRFAQEAAYFEQRSMQYREQQYVSLFTRLSMRSDLHPYFREAIDIDLAKYNRA